MTILAEPVARGDGWTATHMRCCAGPRDPTFEEEHGQICVALVVEGSFAYRSPKGSATLVAGALLLGEPGDGFECGHDHSVGDRSIAFHFHPDLFEGRMGEVAGLHAGMTGRAALPPGPSHARLLVHADGILSSRGSAEEFSYMLLAAVSSTGFPHRYSGVCTRSTARRVQDIVHWLEQTFEQRHRLSELADKAGLSPFHFLRQFKELTGTTPHQFILAQRLRSAAAQLRECDARVSDVAFEAGFGDLSEFNRRFRRLIGATPADFRASFRRHSR